MMTNRECTKRARELFEKGLISRSLMTDVERVCLDYHPDESAPYVVQMWLTNHHRDDDTTEVEND